MFAVTKVYTDEEKIKAFTPQGQEVELPTKKIVRETYCNQGVYWKRGSGLCFGKEDNNTPFWSLGPKAGRFEYKVYPDRIQLCSTISIPIETRDNLYWYGELGYSCPEDLILQYYLDNTFTRKEDDMTFIFGKRKFDDYLIRLS